MPPWVIVMIALLPWNDKLDMSVLGTYQTEYDCREAIDAINSTGAKARHGNGAVKASLFCRQIHEFTP